VVFILVFAILAAHGYSKDETAMAACEVDESKGHGGLSSVSSVGQRGSASAATFEDLE
jgi:hypothetical protein